MENSVVNIYERYRDPNSSVLRIGYHLAVEDNDLKSGDQIYFVGVCSGLISACGLYVIS